MRLQAISSRIDRRRRQAQLGPRPEGPNGDLPPVGAHDLLERSELVGVDCDAFIVEDGGVDDGVGVAGGVPEGAERREREWARGATAEAAERGAAASEDSAELLLLLLLARESISPGRRCRCRRRPHRRGGSARRERAGAQEHSWGKWKGGVGGRGRN